MGINKDSQKVPNLRFKGFTDDWEQRRLGELMDVTSVKRIRQSDWTEDGIRFLRARDVVAASKGEEVIDLLYISEEKYEEYSRISGKVKVGDLLVTGVGSIGIPMLINNEEPLYFKDGNIIWFKNEMQLDGNFFYYSFIGKSIQKYIRDVAGIGTVGTYTIDSGKKTPIQIPDYKEQEKVGNLFNKLDDDITLHQRKLNQLKQLKEALLQQMFPGKGEIVPKLRFAGFEGDWEDRKLKDVSEMYDNLRVPVTASDRIAGETPYYGANGIQDYVKDYTHIGEFVLIAEDGANDLVNYPVHYVTGEVWVNNHAHVIGAIEGKLDNLFLVSRLKSMNFIPWLVGGGRAKLNGDVLKKLPIIIPHLEEQQKIGSFFKHLDNTITLQQRKLDQLKNMKQVLLENMFI